MQLDLHLIGDRSRERSCVAGCRYGISHSQQMSVCADADRSLKEFSLLCLLCGPQGDAACNGVFRRIFTELALVLAVLAP
jgi:hypothetical protein